MSEQFHSRSRLLRELRDGGIRADDWPQYARSRNSLRVRIRYLRELGYGIMTTSVGEGYRHRSAVYTLMYEPDMATSETARTIPTTSNTR